MWLVHLLLPFFAAVSAFFGKEHPIKRTDKGKVTVIINRPITLEQLKKYASSKPLRRSAPRTKR
jgi:hypothetical protein